MPTVNLLPKRLRDLPGGSSHEHADWMIGPVGQHRDSDVVERVNFDVVIAKLREIDPEELDHEIHRFGHWAVGWIEEIATRPGSPCAELAVTLEEDLAESAVLDEDKLSEVEHEEAQEAWESWQRRDVTRDVAKIIAAEHDADPDGVEEAIDRLNSDSLWSIFADVTGPEISYEGGCSYHASKRDLDRVAEQVADLIDFPASAA